MDLRHIKDESNEISTSASKKTDANLRGKSEKERTKNDLKTIN